MLILPMFVLALTLRAPACLDNTRDSPVKPRRHAAPPRTREATPLAFAEFFTQEAGALWPTAKLLSLRGKRVALTGYMAEMENVPEGAFYLCARPVSCDESGGGGGCLPVEHALVIIPSARGKAMGHLSRPLTVIGTLEVGNQSDAEGRVSAVRLRINSPAFFIPRDQPAQTGPGNPQNKRSTQTRQRPAERNRKP
ncbi:MAG: hypothetical protein ACKV2V_15995 [Blastocatellia bacterium]